MAVPENNSRHAQITPTSTGVSCMLSDNLEIKVQVAFSVLHVHRYNSLVRDYT